jgi:hypothetical protein
MREREAGAFLIKLELYIESDKVQVQDEQRLFTVSYSRMQHLIELTSNCMSSLTRHQRNE